MSKSSYTQLDGWTFCGLLCSIIAASRSKVDCSLDTVFSSMAAEADASWRDLAYEKRSAGAFAVVLLLSCGPSNYVRLVEGSLVKPF